MRNRFVIAGAFTVVVVVVGLIVWKLAFSSSPQVSAVPVDASVPVVSVDARPAPVVAIKKRRARITSTNGTVERSKTGETWIVARVGDELDLDERVRTGANSNATLDIGGQASVDLASISQFTVREISDTLSRVLLREGRASARVTDPKRSPSLRMEFSGSKAVAETKKGAFAALATGKGQVTVATKAGRVRLSANNKVVEIPKDMQASVVGNAPPSIPIVPPSLFLKVKRPDRRVQRSKTATVLGETTPGAIISINGVRHGVDSTGRFKVTVPLKEGKNVLVVEAESVAGKKLTADVRPIVVKSRVRSLEGTTTWGAPKNKN